MHKKIVLLLLILVAATGFLFYKKIRETIGITVKPASMPLISEGSFIVPIDGFSPILGNPGAAVTVVEFADFSCARCKSLHYLLSDYVTQNPQKARLIWKGVPIGKWYSAGDALAHQASYCADKQGKFWQFAQTAMTDKNNLTEAGLKKMAEGLQLDTARWWTCANSDEAKLAVATNSALLSSLGMRAVPAVFIDNRLINTDENIDIVEMLKKFAEKK